MDFLDGGWYRLPDGQRVQARRSETITPVWLFVTEDGQPAYTYADSPDDEVQALTFNPITKHYDVVASSVKLTDFRLVTSEPAL
jgi:hypothetical protein